MTPIDYWTSTHKDQTDLLNIPRSKVIKEGGNKMNYKEKFEQLNESGKVFKPTVGVHKITILAEPEETQFVDEKGTTEQIKLSVNVGGDKLEWYISKGTTTRSLYGQLMAIGNYKDKLEGEAITLTVNSSKNRNGDVVNSYVVVEATEILSKLQMEERIE